MKIFGVFCVGLLLAGCASPEMDAKRAAEICTKSGLKEGTDRFADCVGKQVIEMQEARAETGAAIGMAMQEYGRNAPRYTAPTPSYYSAPSYRPTNCTSRYDPYMMTSYTNCY